MKKVVGDFQNGIHRCCCFRLFLLRCRKVKFKMSNLGQQLKCQSKNEHTLFFKFAIPGGLFLFCFQSFQTIVEFLNQKYTENYQSSIRSRDSNSQLLDQDQGPLKRTHCHWSRVGG